MNVMWILICLLPIVIGLFIILSLPSKKISRLIFLFIILIILTFIMSEKLLVVSTLVVVIVFSSFILLIISVPVYIVKRIEETNSERKSATHIKLEDNYVSGVGELTNEGNSFGAVSVGSGGVRPMVGGSLSKHELRGFKIPYNKIMGVDLLIKENGLILLTNSANYNCYINNAEQVQEEIIKRMK